ncbi:MAG TPA: phosphoribosylanthranilate isomerase [Acetobacteraceae bacterium]|jgi:phosphoribosylanthranilate isomerase|nr:phosphoribosylanthranilate isomerase [Acetobacteraceae bacterium]
MPARVKICGVNSAAAIDAAASAGADWVGFVFFPASPRHVTPEAAAALAARHPLGPLRVGLFVDPDEDAVTAALAALRLDALQLYAPPERAAALRLRFGLPVWRAVPVASASDLPPMASGADVLLLEASPPPDASRPGGNARRLDWTLPRFWAAPCPWVLAGGLDPENVAGAIRASGASAVDVSSGVERAPGEKDPALIAAFVAAARAA